MIERELLDAYRKAKYMVFIDNEEHRLYVGEKSQEVELLLTKHSKLSAYFISPENPFSHQLSESDNAARHLQFLNELNKLGCEYYEGYGTDENETWSREKSYLVLSDNETLITGLAQLFEQNAILRVAKHSCIELLVLF